MKDKANHTEESLPHSSEVEDAVLSSILQDGKALLDASLEIPEDAFYHPGARMIYQQMMFMHSKGRGINMMTLNQRLTDLKLIDKIGGPSHIAELGNLVSTAALYEQYKSILLDKLMLRRMIAACEDGIKKAYEFAEDVPKMVSEAAAGIVTIRDEVLSSKTLKWEERIDALQEDWQRRLRGEADHFIQTPWSSFNRELGGIPKGYILLLGPRKSGKSSLAGHMALSAGLKLQKRVDIFTYEVSSENLILRMVSTKTGIPGDIIFQPHRHKPSEVQQLAIRNTLNEIKKSSIRVHDGVGFGSHDIAAMMEANDTQFGVVDYLLRLGRPPEASAKEGTEGSMRENSRILFDATRNKDRKVCRSLLILNHTVDQGDRAGESRWSSSPESDADLTLVVKPDECVYVKSRRDGKAGQELNVTFSGATYSFKEN